MADIASRRSRKYLTYATSRCCTGASEAIILYSSLRRSSVAPQGVWHTLRIGIIIGVMMSFNDRRRKRCRSCPEMIKAAVAQCFPNKLSGHQEYWFLDDAPQPPLLLIARIVFLYTGPPDSGFYPRVIKGGSHRAV